MFVQLGEELLTMMLSTNDQRRVLLIDHDSHRQHLRTVALRSLEVEVHAASSVEDAARSCTRRPYDLVLLATEENPEQTVLLSNELRKIRPRQRIAVFVGAPEYIREFGRGACSEPTEKQNAPGLLAKRIRSQTSGARCSTICLLLGDLRKRSGQPEMEAADF